MTLDSSSEEPLGNHRDEGTPYFEKVDLAVKLQKTRAENHYHSQIFEVYDNT
jgi:hypothetical protein